MAAMTTALTEFTSSGNSRTFTTSGHTALKPRIVIQKRRVPTGAKSVAEDTFDVIHATVDVDGAVLTEKVMFRVTARRPVAGASADTDAALVILRDLVAGDEFANAVSTQEYIA